MTTRPSLSEHYDPLGEHLQDPYPFYRRAQETEPVFYSPLVKAWVVTRYEDVIRVLRNPEVFSSSNAPPRPIPMLPATLEELYKGYPVRPSALNSDGELHQRLRAPMVTALSPERVAALEPFIQDRAERLIDAVEADRQAEFMEAYAWKLPMLVMGELTGMSADEAVATWAGVDALALMVASVLPEAEQAEMARRFVALQHLAGRLVRARRGGGGTDAISIIATMMAPGEEPLAFEQEASVVNNVMELLIAGHITTGPLLGNALWLLLSERDRWVELCDRPELIPMAMDELLRLGTSATGLYRRTTQEVTLGGVTLPEDTPLVLRYGAANRDPARFDRPDGYDHARHPNRHVTFGYGTHFCVGAPLARAQLRTTLEVCTRRLPELRLTEPVEVRPILDSRGPRALRLAW
jgi:cytochrome P450